MTHFVITMYRLLCLSYLFDITNILVIEILKISYNLYSIQHNNVIILFKYFSRIYEIKQQTRVKYITDAIKLKICSD